MQWDLERQYWRPVLKPAQFGETPVAAAVAGGGGGGAAAAGGFAADSVAAGGAGRGK